MKSNLYDNSPLLRLAVCLMAGIVFADNVHLPVSWAWLFVGAVVLALLLWRSASWQSVAIAACLMLLGSWRTEHHRASLSVQWPVGEVVYEAVVASEPVEKPKTMAVDIVLAQTGHKLKCYLHKDQRSRTLRIGDGLRIRSRIEPNSDWRRGTFDYRRYLEVHGFTGRTFVAGWKWQKAQISLGGLSRLERTRLFFLQQRSRLLERLRVSGLADDGYAVVAAMALGDKTALTHDLKEVYSQTGASHVLALSGLHLGIVYTLISLLAVGRRWRSLSQLLTVVAIWAFVFLVGMSVSVVRSAVMISAYALLSLGHRDKMSVNTLAFTAILVLMANPYALFDVGFQMSYLAVFSILLWVPLLDSVFSPKYLQTHPVVRWLWSLVGVSIAAQMGVAPLTAYYFGQFSAYFLLTNFIVIPATTLILYLSMTVLVVPSLAYLLIYIVGLLNAVLLYVSQWPGASISGLHPSVLQTCMAYVVIFAVYLLLVRLTYIRASAKRR